MTVTHRAFVDDFLQATWGYRLGGRGDAGRGYTLQQPYGVENDGHDGVIGEAAFALGHFGRGERGGIPQVVGKVEADRSGLDLGHGGRHRRSLVDRCFDTLREARAGPSSRVLPTWAFVSDMNEFRLYVYGNRSQYQRFVITPPVGDPAVALIDDSDEAAFQRFVFARIFHADVLLAECGKSPLEKLLREQVTHERRLEAEFYREYHAYREHLFAALREANPSFERQGRLRRLVGLTQRLLDRFIFVLYCEDMGQQLHFPPNVLRDRLIEVSDGQTYDETGTQAWDRVRALFAAMREGGPFGDDHIREFNGGLFAVEPELDDLRVPNFVLCARGQGGAEPRWVGAPKTLLFFSTKYDFGTTGGSSGRTLTLAAMGRIFEQSITDLEVMEAHAAGRESMSEITRRKRDGVYYTPEWVTKYIVEQTIGTRLAEIRNELGFDRIGVVTRAQIAANRQDGRKAAVVEDYERALHAYGRRLDALEVVDPACGSGAFLIAAFQCLYEQRRWVAAELERVTGVLGRFDAHEAMRAVLSNNLYGVDINAESIEITRLVLWLHTAGPDRPLTALDENIRCGNALVGTDFCEQLGRDPASMPADAMDRLSPFDWEAAFPGVFARENPGFDCVIGNPPYVKLQNFRRVLDVQAEYLLRAKKADGRPRYESTQTGNFDLYLPFIERGVELLNATGKLGYIAPSAWLVNEHGEGLRRFVKRTKALDRWLDFKSHQVFDEAVTYTAVQLFRGSEVQSLRCAFAPAGPEGLAAVDWGAPAAFVDYSALDDGAAWELMPQIEARLWHRLRVEHPILAESCRRIAVGVQTSADHIYHLVKRGPGRYLSRAAGRDDRVEVQIEDEIMRPLISGAEANRYQRPRTDTYILFPYRVDAEERASLVPAETMARSFPLAWAHLKSHEATLRARERGKMDVDDAWWGYNYPKNLNKQHLVKLMVPRLVLRLFAALDAEGGCCLDNVDVNGILTDGIEDALFLLGILNAPVANWVWRRISKPFQNDYRAANKQFIAPLPIPRATGEERDDVARRARALEDLHTKRLDLVARVEACLASDRCEDDERDESWIWADVKTAKQLMKEAPSSLTGRERTRWAKLERAQRLATHLDGLDVMLQPGATLAVEHGDGELRVLVNGVAAIEGVFLADDEAGFVGAQWRHAMRSIHVTEKFDGKKLLRTLLLLRSTSNPAIATKVVGLDREIQALDVEIEAAEQDMNALVYSLYGLSTEEIRLVALG
ncbi:Eco57I restriction-modification methylase domain-containing protein [Paraliomyxa miuraensis]|uniref:Eco57I restriction-modification methylase domain-containing protein n=1 Tax=Paraliomyxa miuraensis TaxID=376150 RepID=UPI002256F3CD|nr:DNA methyltransferase [Paraliomyxa miuraensis]MCX4242868.1 Eco57I restriction-modification methylase domain-containing protein [Paraliomyxa miuraensis]